MTHALIVAYCALNVLCRGGSGDLPSTEQACRARDTVWTELHRTKEPDCMKEKGYSPQ
jgi:hypothetical protein